MILWLITFFGLLCLCFGGIHHDFFRTFVSGWGSKSLTLFATQSHVSVKVMAVTQISVYNDNLGSSNDPCYNEAEINLGNFSADG